MKKQLNGITITFNIGEYNMASIKVKYIALKPELKNQTQVFEGKTRIDCWNALYEFNDWLAKGQKFETLYSTSILEIKD